MGEVRWAVFTIPCNCTIANEKFTISPSLANCKLSLTSEAVIKWPVNVAFLHKLFKYNTLNVTGTSLQSSPWHLKVPELHFAVNDEWDHVGQSDSKFMIDMTKLATKMDSEEPIFLSSTKEIADHTNFGAGLPTHTITWVLPIINTCASLSGLVLGAIACVKVNKVNLVMASMAKGFTVVVSKSLSPVQLRYSILDDLVHRLSSMIYVLAMIVAVMIVAKILIMLYDLYNLKPFASQVIRRLRSPFKNHSHTDLVLELASPSAYCAIHLMRLDISVHYVSISEHTKIRRLALEESCCNATLNIEWSLPKLVFHGKQIHTNLPRVVPLTFHDRKVIRQIIRYPYTRRLLIGSDNDLYRVMPLKVATTDADMMEADLNERSLHATPQLSKSRKDYSLSKSTDILALEEKSNQCLADQTDEEANL